MWGIICGKLLKGAEEAGWGVLVRETQTWLKQAAGRRAFVQSSESCGDLSLHRGYRTNQPLHANPGESSDMKCIDGTVHRNTDWLSGVPQILLLLLCSFVSVLNLLHLSKEKGWYLKKRIHSWVFPCHATPRHFSTSVLNEWMKSIFKVFSSLFNLKFELTNWRQ